MRGFPFRVVCVSVVAFWMGCTTSSAVRQHTGDVEKLINKVHGPATVCAPKELAYAEMFVDVARYESDRGDSVLADVHVQRARELAREIWSKSQKAECETDIDFDGIVDSLDACPQEAEDFDGMEDDDGCPEEDLDGDGIGRRDRCPTDPEDKDGFEDEDGCPDRDNDKDAILDEADNCPNEPEDRDGFQDVDGCPDPDNDGDQILDVSDQCPNEPEDFDGDEDEDGCPDLYKNIVVMDNMIALKQKVFFATAKARILPQSFEMLNEIADVLLKRPTMVVRIEGHTDSKGSASYNRKLSNKRAKSVRTYLISQGVPPNRMVAMGYGEDNPIEDNRTEEGRALNRRVEFHIIQK